MKTRWNLLWLILLVASCGNIGGNLTQTNTLQIYHTNNYAKSNYVEVVITNTPQQTIAVNYMNAVLGDWFVEMDTVTGNSNGLDAHTNIIYIYYQKTNTYTSISNDGKNGAYCFRFKGDRNVDRLIYNGLGAVYQILTNEYRYAIYSNQYGFRVDMEVLDNTEETRYIRPFGITEFASGMIEEYIIKTNFQKNFRITNVILTTNNTLVKVTQTNGYKLYVDRDKMIDSYSFTLSVSGAISNLKFEPDTNYYKLASESLTKSYRQENEKITFSQAGKTISGTTLYDFSLDKNKSFKMKRIK